MSDLPPEVAALVERPRLGPEYTKMLSRDGETTGAIKNLQSRPCRMEGCRGWRIHVKWPDGRSTYPCSHSCRIVGPDTLQIE